MSEPPKDASAALEEANEAFHAAYDAARQAERTAVPVLVVLADAIVVYRGGAPASFPTTSASFHRVKAAAHVPIAIFASLERPGSSRLALTALRAEIDRARAPSADAPDEELEVERALAPVLERSLAFVDEELARGAPSAEALGAFARATGPLVLELTTLATRIQFATFHAAVERALGAMSDEERGSLQVVVTGDHQARARNLGMQYFRKRLAEPEGTEDRLAYAEGVIDPEAARRLVGTRRIDAKIAEAFFGDPKRLQRDVLGDAVAALLERTDVGVIG